LNMTRWKTILVVSLLGASVALYGIHYFLFKDFYHIAYYMLMDLAFLPLQALIAVLVLNRILEYRDKQLRMEKLNMVIGAFFSEAGTHLLTYISDMDPQLNLLKNELAIRSDWKPEQFNDAAKKLKGHTFKVTVTDKNIAYLKDFLIHHQEFMLRLLENPMVLEHETFTDLLRSVFHLTEELAARPDLADLPEPDMRHITIDIERIYCVMVSQWIAYMGYLGQNYPFLFSFALRTNPFDASASPIVVS
jgi:hypothetical protein